MFNSKLLITFVAIVVINCVIVESAIITLSHLEIIRDELSLLEEDLVYNHRILTLPEFEVFFSAETLEQSIHENNQHLDLVKHRLTQLENKIRDIKNGSGRFQQIIRSAVQTNNIGEFRSAINSAKDNCMESQLLDVDWNRRLYSSELAYYQLIIEMIYRIEPILKEVIDNPV